MNWFRAGLNIIEATVLFDFLGIGDTGDAFQAAISIPLILAVSIAGNHRHQESFAPFQQRLENFLLFS
ncbi:hypothetical protein [Ligaoa zhengdingensis]|uniref:hypothetical protein n=1 Tax=Ligaoa zhengdingensis TaxID=2763658 RepID=UPI0031BB9AF4